MSDCSFSIPVTGSPDALLNKARSAVQGQGGTFNGDSNTGNFKVTVFGNTIAGNYTVAGGNMNIVITDKPFMLSCGMIESYLKGQVS
jgi:hypothetical protein